MLDPCRIAGLGSEDGYARPLTVDLQLLHGVGALEVGGHQDRRLALALEPEREFGRQGGLARTLKPREQDDGGAGLGITESTGLATQDLDQFLVDDLDDLLGGIERLGDLFAAGALLDGADELLDDRQRDVCFEQRDPDLACGGIDVGLGETALASQILEGVGETVGECGEQVIYPERLRVQWT